MDEIERAFEEAEREERERITREVEQVWATYWVGRSRSL
jgi:hypothetical protein